MAALEREPGTSAIRALGPDAQARSRDADPSANRNVCGQTSSCPGQVGRSAISSGTRSLGGEARERITPIGQPSTAGTSEGWRMRGSGERTRSRIETAIPAQPMAIPPRTPIQPATTAAPRAPIG
jgi:hypothetical protein